LTRKAVFAILQPLFQPPTEHEGVANAASQQFQHVASAFLRKPYSSVAQQLEVATYGD